MGAWVLIITFLLSSNGNNPNFIQLSSKENCISTMHSIAKGFQRDGISIRENSETSITVYDYQGNMNYQTISFVCLSKRR